MATFNSALLASDPPIQGLHPSIIVPPRRLHLTLGVMSLDQSILSQEETGSPSIEPPTLERASSLLASLQPSILQLLGDRPLQVGLEQMDILKPEKGKPGSGHVLFVGPDLKSPDGIRLKRVCGA
jgi:activating signal cointegrator complex subunit 1